MRQKAGNENSSPHYPPPPLIVLGANSIAFENGSPVLVVNPVFPGDEGADHESSASSRAHDALQALQHGLLSVIQDGHADAALVRAGALARLCNLFASDAEAAAEVHVHRSTMTRCVRRLRTKIVRAAQQKKLAATQ